MTGAGDWTMRQIIRRNWRTAVASFAIAVDALIILVSFVAAVLITHQDESLSEFMIAHPRLLMATWIIFIGYFTSVGLYRTISYSSFQAQTYRAGKGFVYSIVTMVCAAFALKSVFFTPVFFAIFFLLFPSVYLFVWSGLRTWFVSLQREGFGSWNTLAIGSEPNFRQLLQRVADHPELGYRVTDVIRSSLGQGAGGGMQIDRNMVEKIVERSDIGLIVFASPNLNGSFDELEELCQKNKISMRVVSPESDLLFSKIRLRDISGVPLYSPEHRRLYAIKRITKRGFDIVVGSLCLLVLSPIFITVAIATKLDSRGPILFKQMRSLGVKDEPFHFFKFRSMRPRAEEEQEELREQNESDGALFKIKDDPRVTRVGKRIRRHSIDELPQLINVIKGEMSLVGPRPLPVDDYRRLQEEDHLGGYVNQRARMKPGMTGLWQISGRSNLGFREMVMLDLYYIENQSILFDIEILLQTIPVVLFGKGAY
jgi:exopolysaccharide biosynthesis polyprenyl glycosylphosphotransferase